MPVVLAGDFNVAPGELDIYPTRSWDDDALVHPASRAAFAHLTGQGWTDALRERHPGERIYTFWSYKRRRWERDAGLRLDHLLLERNLRLVDAGVDREVRGEANASDHAPTWAEIEVTARRGRGPAVSDTAKATTGRRRERPPSRR